MTKTSKGMPIATRKFTMGAFLSAVITLGLGSAALADAAGQGTFRTAVCDGTAPPPIVVPLPPGTGGHSLHGAVQTNASTQAVGQGVSSTFITLTGSQAQEGFNGSSAAALLEQDGTGGTAGLTLRLTYPTPVNPTDNNLKAYRLNFKGGNGSQKSTTLHFCFQDQNGTGNVVTYTTRLDQTPHITTSNGFTQIFMGAGTSPANPGNFGGILANNMVLRKVSIRLSNNNNANKLTVGDVRIDTNVGTFFPVDMNLNDGSCNSLFSCPNNNNPAS